MFSQAECGQGCLSQSTQLVWGSALEVWETSRSSSSSSSSSNSKKQRLSHHLEKVACLALHKSQSGVGLPQRFR